MKSSFFALSLFAAVIFAAPAVQSSTPPRTEKILEQVGPIFDPSRAEAEFALIKDLRQDLTQKQQFAMTEVLSNSKNYTPNVLYWLSRALFVNGQKDEAAVWFYSAQLRASYDATITTDYTARQLVIVLTGHFGPPINHYAFQDTEKLKSYVAQALRWDETTPHDYNEGWIYPHGMGLVDKDTPPRSAWEQVAQDNRERYKNGMMEAVGFIKSTNLKGSEGPVAFELNIESDAVEQGIVDEKQDGSDTNEDGENESVYAKIE